MTTIHPGFYTTLQERREGITVSNSLHRLHEDTEEVLNVLFTSETVIVSLPYWEEEDVMPHHVYHIKFSRNNPGTGIAYLFAGDYNPLVVYRSDRIIGVIYEQYYFSRSEEDTAWILRQFEEIEEDPVSYFSRIGERWGKCMICSRKLTAEKSIERAIGPVCYKRIRQIPRFESPKRYDLNTRARIDPGDSYLYDVDSSNPLLNSIEAESIRRFSDLLSFYLFSGFNIAQQIGGQKKLVLTPKEERRAPGRVHLREEAGQIHVSSWPFAQKDEIKAIPGTRWNPSEKAWMVPSAQRARLEKLMRDLKL